MVDDNPPAAAVQHPHIAFLSFSLENPLVTFLGTVCVTIYRRLTTYQLTSMRRLLQTGLIVVAPLYDPMTLMVICGGTMMSETMRAHSKTVPKRLSDDRTCSYDDPPLRLLVFI
jgi:hypothetical protein